LPYPVTVSVLTAGPRAIDADAIAERYAGLIPGAAGLWVEADGNSAVISSDDSDLRFSLASMPQPAPDGAAEAHVRFSVSSFDTGWQLPPHDSHLVLAHAGDSALPPDYALTVFTAVVAAVAETVNAVGIHWSAAQATHAPAFFREMAAGATRGPPVMLWAGVERAQRDGRISLLSRGMPRQLGLPDLLLTAPEARGDTALACFFDLLDYMIRRNQALADGETVIRSVEEKLTVHYIASPAGDGSRVMSVALP